MKILRTLPFVLSALLALAWSMAGGPASFPLVLALLLTVVAAVFSLFGYESPPTSWGSWELAEAPVPRRRRRVVIGLSLFVTFSIATLQWPLRACFWMSRPALERMALQVQRGEDPTPQSVGAFAISGARWREGEVVMWMDDDVLVRKAPGKKPQWSDERTTDLDSQWSLYSEM